MKVKAEEVTTRVETLLEELRATRNEASAARAKAATYKALSIASKAFFVGNSKKIRSKDFLILFQIFDQSSSVSLFMILLNTHSFLVSLICIDIQHWV